MTTRDIPTHPSHLTADWLTTTLLQAQAIDCATVTAFETETMAEGVGLLGLLSRITLTYDADEPQAPRTLVAKFPAAAQENRELAMIFRFYEREVRFYQHIAGRVDLRTPRCYFSEIDPETGDYLLLIEDLSGEWTVGNQLTGASADEAQTAVSSLAGFHAAWWENQELAALDWMPFVNDPVNKSAEESYQKAWEPFVANFGKRVPSSVMATAEKLATNVASLLDRAAEPPRTIIHGDYRIDNLFFGPNEKLAVIDWQITCRGRGAYDLGYFMSQSVDIAARRKSEKQVLRDYHRTLLESGVQGYDFDQCVQDYKLATLFCLVYPVISGGSLDLSNERGVTLVTNMLDRSVSAIHDLDCHEILD